MLNQRPEKVADQFVVLEDKLPELWSSARETTVKKTTWGSLPTVVKLLFVWAAASAPVLLSLHLMRVFNCFADVKYTLLDFVPLDQTNDWMELCRWLVILEIAITGHVLTKYSSILVRQLISFVVRHHHQAFSPLAIRLCEVVALVWPFLCFNVFSTILWLVSLYVMSYPPIPSDAEGHGAQYWIHLPWQFYAERCFLIICVSSYLIVGEKLLLQAITRQFSKPLYRDRIQRCMYAFWSLNVLRKAAGLFNYTHVSSFADNFDRLWAAKSYPYASSDLMTTFILENFVKLGKKSGERKQTMAKQIFRFLAHPSTRDRLHVDDIRPFFARGEVEKVFSVFDVSNAGDISQAEFVKAIDEIYQERGDLIKVLLTNSDVINRLDNLMLVVVGVLIFLIIFPTIGFSPSKALVPRGISIGSMVVAGTVIFGETIKSIFAAIIFLFATHPYDVGDRIYMDQCNYFVRRIGLLSTTFERWDGFIVYIPNSVLATKSICNVRRTTLQSQRVELVLPATVSGLTLTLFEDRLKDFVCAESRDFAAIRCYRYEMRDMNQLAMVISIRHRYNFQDGYERSLRNNKFMRHLVATVRDLGIEYRTTVRGIALQKVSESDDKFCP